MTTWWQLTLIGIGLGVGFFVGLSIVRDYPRKVPLFVGSLGGRPSICTEIDARRWCASMQVVE